jgi:hypothetical protein
MNKKSSIEVEYCIECPHLISNGLAGDTCAKLDRDMFPSDIPDDCPLEDWDDTE